MVSKNIYLFNLIVIASFWACSAKPQSSDANNSAKVLVANTNLSVKNIAEISYNRGSINNNISAAGFYTANDGGEGTFYWDNTSTAEPISGMVIKPADAISAGRWIRQTSTDVVNLKWFGVKGDTSNETPAIQAAVNYSVGKTLLIPKGSFNCLNVQLVSNITIDGTGTLKCYSAAKSFDEVLFASGKHGITIKNITLDGNIGHLQTTLSTGALLRVYGTTNCLFSKCRLVNSPFGGIDLYRSTFIVADNIYSENTDVAVITHGYCHDITIKNCTVNAGTSEGISLYGNATLPKNYSGNPVNYSTTRLDSLKNVQFDIGYDSCIIVSNNTITGKTVGVVARYAKNFTIKNNSVQNCLYGVAFYDFVPSTSLGTESGLIDSNNIYNCKTGIGINGNNITVSNNHIQKTAYPGVQLGIKSFKATNIHVINNTILDANDANVGLGGIYLQNTSSSTIENNTVDDTRPTTITYFGIRVDGAECKNNKIINNKFKKFTYHAIFISQADNTLIQNNSGDFRDLKSTNTKSDIQGIK